MPNFIVLKNGTPLDMITASGNLKALCQATRTTGLPSFPMYAAKGVLFAKVGRTQYMVFDCTDNNAHQVVEDILNEKRVPTVKKKRATLIPSLFRLPQLPILTMEAPAYVV